MEDLTSLPDDERLRPLAALLAGSRRTEAELVARIGEVDARRLYAREATSSMFVYCLERLHLSEHEAYVRIAAARAARQHPVILDMLADGRLHLTTIALLAPHLTRENRIALLERATHKTKREIEEIVAELAPQPDVRSSIRRLPLGRVVVSPPTRREFVAGPPPAELNPPAGVVRTPSGALDPPPEPARFEPQGAPAHDGLRPEQVDSNPLDGLIAAVNGTAASPGSRAGFERSVHDAFRSSSETAAVALRWAAGGESKSARIEPLSPRRYKVQFTASAHLRDKLERLTALMRSSVPDADLAAVIEAAVTEKLERLEARRFGRVASATRAEKDPAKPAGTAPVKPSRENANGAGLRQAASRSRHLPAEVRRTVYERDQGRCRFVGDQGRRCTARLYLQLHHGIPYAVGGEHSPTSLSLLCATHNRLMAEIDFGEKAQHDRRQCSMRLEPPANERLFGRATRPAPAAP